MSIPTIVSPGSGNSGREVYTRPVATSAARKWAKIQTYFSISELEANGADLTVIESKLSEQIALRNAYNEKCVAHDNYHTAVGVAVRDAKAAALAAIMELHTTGGGFTANEPRILELLRNQFPSIPISQLVAFCNDPENELVTTVSFLQNEFVNSGGDSGIKISQSFTNQPAEIKKFLRRVATVNFIATLEATEGYTNLSAQEAQYQTAKNAQNTAKQFLDTYWEADKTLNEDLQSTFLNVLETANTNIPGRIPNRTLVAIFGYNPVTVSR